VRKKRLKGLAAVEAIRFYLRTVITDEDDRRGGIVRKSDAAESRRFCIHAGGRIQDYSGESADWGGARRKVVCVIARSAARIGGEDRSGGCVPAARVCG